MTLEKVQQYKESIMKLLPITINGIEINPTNEGLYCLNDIAKAGGLTGTKADPSQWRTKVAEYYKRMQFLQALNQGKKGSKTYGTEEVAIAYAMWVSIDFYSLVVKVFCEVRNDLGIMKQVNKNIQQDNTLLRHKAEKTGRELDQRKAVQGQLLHSAIVANSRLRNLDNKNVFTFSDLCSYYGLSQKRVKAYWCKQGLLTQLPNKSWKATDRGLTVGLINQPSKFGTLVRINKGLFNRYSNTAYLDKLITNY